MAPAPEDGDVVVRLDRLDGTHVYVLHVAPRADQYSLRSRDEAVAQAIAFARHAQVRAWLDEGAHALVLLENFRGGES